MSASTLIRLFPALIALFVLVSCGDDDGVTPSDSPTVSGTPAATASPVAGEISVPNPYQIVVNDLNGATDVVAQSENNLQFAWSPDGDTLALIEQDYNPPDPTATIRIIDLSGESRQLASVTGTLYPVQWSPDGFSIITQVNNGSDVSVVSIDAATGELRDLASGSVEEYVSAAGWLPSGELMLIRNVDSSTSGNLVAIDPVTRDERVLSDLHVSADGFAGGPALSPDGLKLAVPATADPNADCLYGSESGGIYVIDLASGDAEHVYDAADCTTASLTWSPAMDRLAFGDLYNSGDLRGIKVLDIASGETTQFTTGLEVPVAWLDDGRILAYRYTCIACEGGAPTLLAIDPATAAVTELETAVQTKLAPGNQRYAAVQGDLVVKDLAGNVLSVPATAEDGQSIAGLQWSSDESRIAFLRFPSPGTHVFEVDADGSHLESGAFYPGPSPLVSPDGARIAVIRPGPTTDEKASVLALANADGSGETELAVEGVGSVAWSPDSSRIAFLGGVTGAATERALYVASADATELRQLDFDTLGGAGPLSWSPDGSRLALASSNVYVLDVESEESVTIQTPVQVQGDKSTSISWSANGEKIAFLADNVIHVASSDGSSDDAFDVEEPFISNISLSPDGSLVALLAPVNTPPQQTQLIVLDVESGQERPVAQGGLISATIAWAPDSSAIAFAMTIDGEGGLYTAEADGSSVRRLTAGGAIADIRWLDEGRIRFTTGIFGL